MASAIRVKVRVEKVINLLTTKLDELRKSVDEYPKLYAKYEKDRYVKCHSTFFPHIRIS